MRNLLDQLFSVLTVDKLVKPLDNLWVKALKVDSLLLVSNIFESVQTILNLLVKSLVLSWHVGLILDDLLNLVKLDLGLCQLLALIGSFLHLAQNYL